MESNYKSYYEKFLYQVKAPLIFQEGYFCIVICNDFYETLNLRSPILVGWNFSRPIQK